MNIRVEANSDNDKSEISTLNVFNDNEEILLSVPCDILCNEYYPENIIKLRRFVKRNDQYRTGQR